MDKVTWELAFRLRCIRKLQIPNDKECESPRLKEIVERQSQIFIELSKLTEEMYRLDEEIRSNIVEKNENNWIPQ